MGHSFVIAVHIITRMACIIYLALVSATLLWVGGWSGSSSHKVYTRHLERLTSDRWVIYFYKVCSPSPWTLRKLIKGSVLISRVSSFTWSLSLRGSEVLRVVLGSCWTDDGCSTLRLSFSGSLSIQYELVLFLWTIYWWLLPITCRPLTTKLSRSCPIPGLPSLWRTSFVAGVFTLLMSSMRY